MNRSDRRSGLNLYNQSFISKETILIRHSIILRETYNFHSVKEVFQCSWEKMKDASLDSKSFFKALGLTGFLEITETVPNFMKDYYSDRQCLRLLTPRLALKGAYTNFNEVYYDSEAPENLDRQIYHIDSNSAFGSVVLDFPLPCGNFEQIIDAQEIKKRLYWSPEGKCFIDTKFNRKAIGLIKVLFFGF